MVDITKAFDNASLHHALSRLSEHSSPQTVSLVESLNSSRYLRSMDPNRSLVLDKETSQISQGTCIGPFCYIMSLEHVLEQSMPGKCELIAYSDDLLLASNLATIGESLEWLMDRLAEISLTVNPRKTVVVNLQGKKKFSYDILGYRISNGCFRAQVDAIRPQLSSLDATPIRKLNLAARREVMGSLLDSSFDSLGLYPWFNNPNYEEDIRTLIRSGYTLLNRAVEPTPLGLWSQRTLHLRNPAFHYICEVIACLVECGAKREAWPILNFHFITMTSSVSYSLKLRSYGSSLSIATAYTSSACPCLLFRSVNIHVTQQRLCVRFKGVHYHVPLIPSDGSVILNYLWALRWLSSSTVHCHFLLPFFMASQISRLPVVLSNSSHRVSFVDSSVLRCRASLVNSHRHRPISRCSVRRALLVWLLSNTIRDLSSRPWFH